MCCATASPEAVSRLCVLARLIVTVRMLARRWWKECMNMHALYDSLPGEAIFGVQRNSLAKGYFCTGHAESLEESLMELWDALETIPATGLLILVAVFVSFGLLGWALSPGISRKVEESTSGYVKWMIEMFDKMFLTISGRVCLYCIIISTIVWFFLAYWLTAGLPSGGVCTRRGQASTSP